MILRTPDYYFDFHCIGSSCAHNCCIGWGVDIDEHTFEKYNSAPGKFGKRLRSAMTLDEGCHTFKMNGERCPFLNVKNLCDIYISMGEKSLCIVCTEYPRFGTQYGALLEKGLGFSCEEAGRLILSHKERVVFNDSEYCGEAEETDKVLLNALLRSRDTIIQLLQNRSLEIEQRILLALSYAKEVQGHINMNEPQNISGCFAPHKIPKHNSDYKTADIILEFMGTLEAMEDNWRDCINEMRRSFSNEAEYIKKLNALKNQGHEYIWEQIAVYFIYRYYLNAMYDNDAYSKVRFAAVCLIVLRSMLAAAGSTELDTAVEAARRFSANIEHSAANIESIYDEIMLDPEWDIERAV